jgi:hypothetical protein
VYKQHTDRGATSGPRALEAPPAASGAAEVPTAACSIPCDRTCSANEICNLYVHIDIHIQTLHTNVPYISYGGRHCGRQPRAMLPNEPRARPIAPPDFSEDVTAPEKNLKMNLQKNVIVWIPVGVNAVQTCNTQRICAQENR